ncbi:MAG: DNA cytosine methyltransferase [Labedaea sp.]
MTALTVLSLFTGIGGLDLGLQWAGMRVVGQVEIDPFCQRVLARHWPEVPRHDDVHTCIPWWRSRPRPTVDVIAGGFPCQPVSTAGKGHGQTDHRWLWPAMVEVIAALRPEWVVWENVPGLRTRGLHIVHSDLLALGYHHTVGITSACAVGAPHMRKRLLGVAHAPGQRRREGRPRGPAGQTPNRNHQPPQGMDQHPTPPQPATRHWTHEPRMDRLVDGPPAELALRALGNTVVPHIAEHIGRLITTTHHDQEAAA